VNFIAIDVVIELLGLFCCDGNDKLLSLDGFDG